MRLLASLRQISPRQQSGTWKLIICFLAFVAIVVACLSIFPRNSGSDERQGTKGRRRQLQTVFGVVDPSLNAKREYRHDFVIWNELSVADQVAEVETSCTCTVTNLYRGTEIPPNGTLTLQITTNVEATKSLHRASCQIRFANAPPFRAELRVKQLRPVCFSETEWTDEIPYGKSSLTREVEVRTAGRSPNLNQLQSVKLKGVGTVKSSGSHQEHEGGLQVEVHSFRLEVPLPSGSLAGTNYVVAETRSQLGKVHQAVLPIRWHRHEQAKVTPNSILFREPQASHVVAVAPLTTVGELSASIANPVFDVKGPYIQNEAIEFIVSLQPMGDSTAAASKLIVSDSRGEVASIPVAALLP